jgi:serine/threonine protein kinase
MADLSSAFLKSPFFKWVVETFQITDEQPFALWRGQNIEKTKIAEGNFGEVYRALGTDVRFSGGSKKSYILKKPKVEGDDFAVELAVLAVLSSPDTPLSYKGLKTIPNLVQVYGFWIDPTSKNWDTYIVMEEMKGGSLLDHLRHKTKEFTVQQALHVFIEITKPLISFAKYTEIDKKPVSFVHRDLFSRNVLIDGTKVSLADFGLFRELVDGKYVVRKKDYVVPKWEVNDNGPSLVAPEVEYDDRRVFTLASDVFSFGILMWEVLNSGLSESDWMIKSHKPAKVPIELWNIVTSCWNPVESRPTIHQVATLLDEVKLKVDGSVNIWTPVYLDY